MSLTARSTVLLTAALVAVTGLSSSGAWATPTAEAATDLPPGAVRVLDHFPSTQTRSYADGVSAGPDTAYDFEKPSGDLGVAVYQPDDGTMRITSYDAATLEPTGPARSIAVTGAGSGDYPVFGGFYAAADGDLYTLAGRNDVAKDDAYDVVEIKRYDADLHLVGTGHLQGGASQGGVKGVMYPFAHGAAHLTMASASSLVVHMPRLAYSAGQEAEGGPQASLTFAVDVRTMTATSFEDLGQRTTVAHRSLQQLVAATGAGLVTVDHGDADPRSLRLALSGFPDSPTLTVHDVLPFAGADGSDTGATLDDVVVGPQGVVVLGTTAQQTTAPHSVSEPQNVVAVHWDPVHDTVDAPTYLTDYPTSGNDATPRAGEPRATQVGHDRFAVLSNATANGVVHTDYRLIDSSGAVLARQAFPGALHTSSSQPVLIDGRLVWAGPTGSTAAADRGRGYLYAVDVSDPLHPALGAPYDPDRAAVQHTDFDGDGSSELGVFRPSTGQWVVSGEPTVGFGRSGDVPVPADYDGDGRADYAVFRPSTGTWYVRGEAPVAYGRSGDVPLPADYDADGAAEFAVYRSGTWYVRGRSPVVVGEPGDLPVPADYDGDTRVDLAVYRPSWRRWIVDGGTRVTDFGRPFDVPAPSDHDGDGAADLAVYRPSNGTWFVRGQEQVTIGRRGDVPLR